MCLDLIKVGLDITLFKSIELVICVVEQYKSLIFLMTAHKAYKK